MDISETVTRIWRAPARRREWRKLLESCTLDPTTLVEPIEEPPNGDFIVCGCPRSGTSLVAAQLFRPPELMVIMEPWDGLRLEPGALFRSLREEMLATGELRRGRLDVRRLETDGTVEWVRDGQNPVGVEIDDQTRLGVKWPAFWRYLDKLPNTKFLVCLRHPVDVISSFERVGGRLARGLDYDVAFNRQMNDDLLGATQDLATRRALMYEYVNSRILPHLGHPNVLAVRYERWFEDPEALMEEITSFIDVPSSDPIVALQRSRVAEHTSELISLVERHCPSAGALGYTVASDG